MLNRAPIVLNCFSRGGSNIFWNIFLTHPEVCSPIHETLEIFRAGWRAPTRLGYRLVLLTRQWRLFDQWYLHPRRPVPKGAEELIDRALYERKLTTLSHPEMKYKAPGEVYRLEEVAEARLSLKNNNGLAFLSDLFLAMYPDVTFLALARHPVALYESHRRRRITRSVKSFARFYNTLAGRMLADRERCPRYHILRFEDILVDPMASLHRCYELAGLDPGAVGKVRFRAKPHLHRDGSYGTPFETGQHYWFDPAELGRYFEPEINQLQAERVERREREYLLAATRPRLEALGYLA